MSNLFSLEGRVALVTGASRGLGWAVAEALAEHGARTVLSSRDAAALESRAETLRAAGGIAEVMAFDVSNRDEGTRAIKDVVVRHGRLDILVNNAGVVHRDDLPEFADEDWDRVIEANLTACFRLSRAAAPQMIAQGAGRIINMASIMSRIARPGIFSYVASKSGLAGLTRALAVELGPKGITCNAIAPGYIETEMTAGLTADAEFDAYVRGRTPLRRWGQPGEIGAVALFLASDAASYVNGHVLTVDGGLTAAL